MEAEAQFLVNSLLTGLRKTPFHIQGVWFQWQEATIKGKVCVDIIQHYPLEWKHPEWANLYPAPTLQEVLAVCKDIATLPPDPKYTKVFDLTTLTPQNTLEIYLSKTKKEPHNANC